MSVFADSWVIYLDGGTTQTRAWAMRGSEVLAEARVSVGARDTARDGSPVRLRAAVRALVDEVTHKASATTPVSLVAAAGMITSPQGLCEVPHVPAPAAAADLARGAKWQRFDDVATTPILFIPGVRTGPSPCDGASVTDADVMRGEEVLCVGLLKLGRLPQGGVVMNVGSHWKAIGVDPQKGITGSVTTLSGELIQSVATQTILASAVPAQWPDTMDPRWIDAGAAAFHVAGLSRALFCVRLLDQRADCRPEQRFAFLLGAVIASDFAALISSQRGSAAGRVVVTGRAVVAQAWVDYLARRKIDAALVSETDIDAAFRTGCAAVVAAAGPVP